MGNQLQIRHYFYSILIVLSVAALCYPFTDWIGYHSVALILLLTVSILAMRFRLYPILVAASLSTLILGFFFIPPYFTLTIGSQEDALLLIMYFVVALLSGIFNYKLCQFEQITYQKEERETSIKHYNTLFDLILLDLGLPDDDGQNLLKILRGWFQKPIIILSARHAETDIIKALDNEASDYLVKPFRTGELLGRIRSAFRLTQIPNIEPILTIKNLTIDFTARTVKKNNELVKLTTTEYAFLMLLVKNEGKVLTHAFILREIWGPCYIEHSEYPRIFVGQLRKKIEDTRINRP